MTGRSRWRILIEPIDPSPSGTYRAALEATDPTDQGAGPIIGTALLALIKAGVLRFVDDPLHPEDDVVEEPGR